MSDAKLIDTHAHLDSSQYDDDRQEVIARALDGGLSHIVTVGCDIDSSRAAVELAVTHPQLYASVGIHPHDAPQATDEGIAVLRQLVTPSNRVVAIGEIGLDFYRDRAPRDVQRLAFRRQIALARELKLPLIIHDRDAHDEVLQILREENAFEVGGVLHCFSGDLAMAKACLDLGFYLSFPGTITYPKNEAAREVVKAVPTERILIETDCPYLSPQKYRGKRNEPLYVRHTAEKVVEIKGLSLNDIARITSLNASTLFRIDAVDTTTRIAYRIRNSLYLNITNRCTNSCTFCPKFSDFMVKGHQLRLDHEPSADEVRTAIGDPTRYDEVVFCGFGEPLIRLDLVLEIARWLKEQGGKVRINSDGQANLVHGRNILPELKGLIDSISVSLNAPDATTYQRLCNSSFGEAGYEAVKAFLREATKHIPSVTASAVGLAEVDMEACRKLATELGVAFRDRPYNEVG
ncbi:MAG: radical SAM protein [Desulfuromonas sp.]|nr:MAG: radical SAM protein [Desulfuromonas sp.]